MDGKRVQQASYSSLKKIPPGRSVSLPKKGSNNWMLTLHRENTVNRSSIEAPLPFATQKYYHSNRLQRSPLRCGNHGFVRLKSKTTPNPVCQFGMPKAACSNKVSPPNWTTGYQRLSWCRWKKSGLNIFNSIYSYRSVVAVWWQSWGYRERGVRRRKAVQKIEVQYYRIGQ